MWYMNIQGTGSLFKACDKVNDMYKFIRLVGMKVSMWGSNTSGLRTKSILSLAREYLWSLTKISKHESARRNKKRMAALYLPLDNGLK